MIYKDIGKNVETRFGTSSYELKKPLQKGKNKKVISVMRDDLGGEIVKEFVRAKTCKLLNR